MFIYDDLEVGFVESSSSTPVQGIAVIEYEYKSVLSETKERTHRALWLYGGVKRQQQALKHYRDTLQLPSNREDKRAYRNQLQLTPNITQPSHHPFV